MKNTLVQYHGGGYDGCFWEWNYFFLDKDGQFHDVFSSGTAGIRNVAESYVLDISDGDVYTYDMTDDKAIEEFSQECNVVNVTGVLQWFDDNPQDGIDFFVICSECGERQTDMSELSLEEWHGCGGMQITADALLCSACYSMGFCDCCNDYVGESDIIALQQVELDSLLIQENSSNLLAIQEFIEDGMDAVCKYCLEDKADELNTEERKDMLLMSLSTGKPDLFSDDMRWFWEGV